MRRIHGIAVLAGLVASLVCCSATSQPGSFAEGGTTPADAAVVQTGSDSSLPANAVDAQATGPDARLGFGRDALADGSSSGLADATSTSVIEAGGSSAVDAGTPSAITSPWLVPMNQARAAVGDAPLQWDPIAAAVAQAYASQCDFQHNPNASAQYDARGGTGIVGENIAAGAPTETISAAVTDWISEQASYDHASNSCAAFKECGHYTQIVWSSTTGVGCAKVSCTVNSPFGSGPWDFSVCDFSPAGNYVGQAPY